MTENMVDNALTYDGLLMWMYPIGLKESIRIGNVELSEILTKYTSAKFIQRLGKLARDKVIVKATARHLIWHWNEHGRHVGILLTDGTIFMADDFEDVNNVSGTDSLYNLYSETLDNETGMVMRSQILNVPDSQEMFLILQKEVELIQTLQKDKGYGRI